MSKLHCSLLASGAPIEIGATSAVEPMLQGILQTSPTVVVDVQEESYTEARIVFQATSNVPNGTTAHVRGSTDGTNFARAEASSGTTGNLSLQGGPGMRVGEWFPIDAAYIQDNVHFQVFLSDGDDSGFFALQAVIQFR